MLNRIIDEDLDLKCDTASEVKRLIYWCKNVGVSLSNSEDYMLKRFNEGFFCIDSNKKLRLYVFGNYRSEAKDFSELLKNEFK